VAGDPDGDSVKLCRAMSLWRRHRLLVARMTFCASTAQSLSSESNRLKIEVRNFLSSVRAA
jgi:hypothetical protein